MVEDAGDGDGVHGRLGDAEVSRPAGRTRPAGRIPSARPGKVAVPAVREHDVRIIPLVHCADSRVSISVTARSTDSGASPTVTNAASQLHMCGYSLGAALVIVPRVVAAEQVGSSSRELRRENP